MTFSNYMRRLFKTEPQMYADKLRATDNADEILRAARNWVNEALLHPRADAIIDFARGDVLLHIGSNDYNAQVVVGNRGNNGLLLYDIINLSPAAIQERIKRTGADRFITKAQNEPGDSRSASADATLAQDGKNVKALNGEKFSDVVKLGEAGDTKEQTRFSLKSDSAGRELTDEQREYFKDSKATDSDGRLMVLYHQTESEFTVFDPRRQGAGARDDGTPFGIFLKSSDRDIGLKGKKQMALYANITNPLTAMSRDDLTRKLRQLSPEYDKAVQQHEALDREYHEKFEAAKTAWRDYVTQWRKENPDGKRSELYDVPEFNRLFEAEDAVVDEWTEKADALSLQAKEALTRALRDAGYDGVFLLNDAGSWGRSTDAYIALDPEQVKNVDNKTPTSDPDIRYSLKGSSDIQREVAILQKENRLLKEKVEYWSSQTKVTKDGKETVRQADVDKLARRIIKDYSSQLDSKDLSSRLADLGDLLIRNGDGKNELTWSLLKWRAEDIAKDIVNSAEILNDEQYRQYSDLRSYLRTTPLILGPKYQTDIADFNDFRKRNFGRLNLKTKGSTNIDQVYEEMSSTWPEFFDTQRETNPTDQLLHIVDVLDGLRPVYENPFSYDMNAAAEHVANDILDSLMGGGVRQASTFADRAIKRERDRRISQLQRLKAEYQKREAKKRERASDQKARDRLLRIAKRLQNKKLPAVNRALLDQYIGDLDTVAKSMTGKTLEKLSNLWEWYADRKVNDPDFIADPNIEKAIARLSKRHISDLSAGDVAALTDVLLNIENELRTERKLIDSEDRRDTYHMGEEVIRDIYATNGSKGDLFDRFIVTETLSPLREVRRLTGYVDADPLLRLTQELANGQRRMLDYQMKAEKAAQPFAEDKAFSRMFSGPKAESVEITGWTKDGPTTVKITPAMRTSLYLHSLNDQNLKHINDGGITVPDEKLYRKGKLAEAYNRGTTVRLTPTQVRAICGGMTEREKAFARMAHDYFNKRSRTAINEVSERLKGYSIAQVENYFPINTDTSFTRSDFDTVKFDGSIEGMGFLKDRRNAANPILLRDVNMVLEQSIQQHAKYYGLAIPIRNFNKVWGVTTGSFNEDGSRNAFESSVQQAVKKQWGETGYGYIEKMMTDLQNGTAPKNEWAKALGKIRSNYAGAVLTLNASVAMKQAASYPTAAAVLGWRPLIAAFKDFGRVDLDLIAKYTPLQWYRSKGFSTKELGDLKTANKQLPAVLNWVQGADLLTTRKLWKASEYYVRQHSPGLARGSEVYYRAVADIYNRVIEETQPNYTTMQRPQLLRSDDSLMSNLAMFKTQPFQNFNILYDAAVTLRPRADR